MGVVLINELIYSKNDVFETKSYLINYNDKNFRILKLKYHKKKGFEEIKDLFKFGTEIKTENDLELKKAESLKSSLSRSKAKIRELALCNDFEFFGTITLNGFFCSRYELTDAQNLLKKELRNIRRFHSSNFKYLIITEKHKDNAFHFHGLFSGLDLYKNQYGFLYSPNLYKLGFNSFSPIKSKTRVANYITKYITKDCVRNSTNQVYIRSRNLITASKEELKNTDFLDINNMWKFDNDFVSIYDYNLENLTEFEKNFLFDIIKQ